MAHRPSLAVIGSGISGLSAAWLLRQRYSVTLFEANDYLGGHSHTVEAKFGNHSVAVDTGFIVYNDWTYPNLIAFFKELDVKTQKSDMSLAVSLKDGWLEYGTSTLGQTFAQKRNWLRPGFYKMLLDLLRFYKESTAWLKTDPVSDLSLDEYLRAGKYCQEFIDYHLLPMGAAIWSTTAEKMLEFPALSFLRFCDNHGLLQVNQRPQWRTVSGGSREYVKRIARDLENVKFSTVKNIRRINGKVQISADQNYIFDKAVLACHGDQALKLLQDPSDEERRTLSCFAYEKNQAVLHSDARLMPKLRQIWSSWNYLSTKNQSDKLYTTYWMNNLQNIDSTYPLFVTLNPPFMPEKVHGVYDYDHPLYNAGAMAAQTKIPALQGINNTYFCGSYCGYGFHEDGLKAAIAVAEKLGVTAPWLAAEERRLAA
ncbi:MAG: NAD(P)/FAD-dependent oxidoreductase [Dongiaceae bacterium]